MATPNTYPAPIGITVAFTNLSAGATTPNFNLTPGLWVVSLEFYGDGRQNNTNQVTLVQVTASSGAAANSTVMTMTRSGYYNFVVPVGPVLTYNFQTTNGCANVRASQPTPPIGPS